MLNEICGAPVAIIVHVVDFVQCGVPRGLDDDQHVGVGIDDLARVDTAIATLEVSEQIDQPGRGQDQVDRPRARSDEELAGVAVASDAVQKDRSERMPRALHRFLGDGEVVLDLRVELRGHVGHVEDFAQLRHRLEHRLFGRRRWPQLGILAVGPLEPCADACGMQLRTAPAV